MWDVWRGRTFSRPARKRGPTRVIALVAAAALAACTPAGGTDQGGGRGGAAPGAASSAHAVAGPTTGADTPLPADTTTVVVYRSPTCGCCKGWTAHMRESGFRVTEVEQDDLTAVKSEAGVPPLLHACHTARVGGYVVEGHVPAADVRRLLAERPAVTGIAAPGMPVGSPGMEGPYPPERYNVLTFDRTGGGRVFASH